MQTVSLLERAAPAGRVAPYRRQRQRLRYTQRDKKCSPEKLRRTGIIDEAFKRAAWGVAASIDIYNCAPETIRNADKIHQFVRELCDLISMKRFGDTQVIHFGEDERVAGFSMIQLIETSLISAHFANQSNTTYLDVFSCKPYEPAIVEEFALKFFGGSRCITHVNLRL
ncbi:MAG: S-adenosylmethionine decarboxylase [Candidatus Euphemobacter frigidus]|nr:S-adenosylmethionine decarboxylase [Candidatus Euphemobacter frigidus]MDP8275025.1 S-adenosylmethionine decarboxylase [Candidatus Euphemobacter frigidus]